MPERVRESDFVLDTDTVGERVACGVVALGDSDPVILRVLDSVTETVGLAVKRWLVGIGERDSVAI